LNLW